MRKQRNVVSRKIRRNIGDKTMMQVSLNRDGEVLEVTFSKSVHNQMLFDTNLATLTKRAREVVSGVAKRKWWRFLVVDSSNLHNMSTKKRYERSTESILFDGPKVAGLTDSSLARRPSFSDLDAYDSCPAGSGLVQSLLRGKGERRILLPDTPEVRERLNEIASKLNGAIAQAQRDVRVLAARNRRKTAPAFDVGKDKPLSP